MLKRLTALAFHQTARQGSNNADDMPHRMRWIGGMSGNSAQMPPAIARASRGNLAALIHRQARGFVAHGFGGTTVRCSGAGVGGGEPDP